MNIMVTPDEPQIVILPDERDGTPRTPISTPMPPPMQPQIVPTILHHIEPHEVNTLQKQTGQSPFITTAEEKTQSSQEDKKKQAIAEFIRKNTQSADNVSVNTFTPAPQINPYAQLSAQTHETNEYLGKVVSEFVHVKIPWIIRFISSLFFVISFSYTTMTILLTAIIIALAIALSNAGAPGFVYLKYYPKVGLLPIFSGAITLIFMYTAFKIREGSRQAWFMGVTSLATLPVTFSLVMPVLSYPLIRLVSIYAGSPQKPLMTPSISVHALSQFFSAFLFFEAILLLLIVGLRNFKYPSASLSSNAKTSLLVICIILCLPVAGVSAYGYYAAQTFDYGFTQTASLTPYHLYHAANAPQGREFSSKFFMNDELAGKFNAVRVAYDVPLPTIMQTGKNSQIILKQVQVNSDFNIEQFVSSRDRNVDSVITTVNIPYAFHQQGYVIAHSDTTYLYTIFPENVLLEISSQTATSDELTEFANTIL